MIKRMWEKYYGIDVWDIFTAFVCAAVIIIAAAAPFLMYSDYPDEHETPHGANVALLRLRYTPPAIDVGALEQIRANRKAARAAMDEVIGIKAYVDTITFPTVELVLTDLGSYYVTGYTSVECGGSTMTASGATCHKAASYEDSFYSPTTCAIDPALHDFGDLFFIESFGLYVAEDTGSAVKGKHLDLYFWDSEYNYALSITGYYKVYAAEVVYGEVKAADYNIQRLVAEKVIGWTFEST